MNGVNLQAGSMGNEEVSVFSDGMSDNAPLAAGDGERQEIAGGEGWILYDDGELVISDTESISGSQMPWHVYRDKIYTVSIKKE